VTVKKTEVNARLNIFCDHYTGINRKVIAALVAGGYACMSCCICRVHRNSWSSDDAKETATPTPMPQPTIGPGVSGAEESEKAVAGANNMFGFDLYKQLTAGDNPDVNIFFSPCSISSAFALVYKGCHCRRDKNVYLLLRVTEQSYQILQMKTRPEQIFLL